jgi:NDP-sugar pyrophosphorylase family protein
MGRYTRSVPKALIAVAGEPFAAHQLRWLASQGVKDVVYSIGYLGQMVRDFAGDGSRWGIRITYVDEGARLLGTAGALREAVAEGALDERFLVLYGDSYLGLNVRAAWDHFIASGAPALMTVYANREGRDRSNVRMSAGRIVIYDKHSADPTVMTHIDYGLLGMSVAAILKHVPAGQASDLGDVLHELSAIGQLVAHVVTEPFFEIGSLAGLQALEARLTLAADLP